MNISRVLVGVVAGSLLLSGCAGEEPAEIAEPAPIVTESPSPTPTPTPEPTKPALNELVLTTEGLGYLVIGQPVPESDLPIVRLDPNACPASLDVGPPPRWLADYPEGKEAFYLYTQDDAVDGAVRLIASNDGNISSDRGVGVGSTLAEVKSAYPDARASNTTGVQMLIVDGVAGKLRFEVQDDNDGSKLVDFMTVVRLSDFDLGIAFSGYGGTCHA